MRIYKTPKHIRDKARVKAELMRRQKGVPKKKDFIGRFNDKCEQIPFSGCILWLGHIGHAGHGHTFFNGKVVRAHRVAWILKNGNIPDGLCVLHSCDVACCVNPDHLFLGTQSDNMKDMFRKGRNRNGLPNGSGDFWT